MERKTYKNVIGNKKSVTFALAEIMAEKIKELSDFSPLQVVAEVSDLSVLDKINPIIKKHGGDCDFLIKTGDKIVKTVYKVDGGDKFKRSLEEFGIVFS